MNNQTDKLTEKALQLNELLNKISCFSEIGNRLHKNFKLFKSSQKAELIDYYDKIDLLLKNIKQSPDFITNIGSSLAHFQWILKTLEDTHSRTLELFEIFEVKFFIYYYQKIIAYLTKKNIKTIIPLRNFNELFGYLDMENQITPSFHLNPHYSEGLLNVCNTLDKFKSIIELESKNLKDMLIKELHLYEFNGKITVSRMNTEKIALFSNSEYLKIDNENFANITYTLKKNERILQSEEQITLLNKQLNIEEALVREKITLKIREQIDLLIFAFHEIADFDLLLAKAIFANKYDCVSPIINDEYQIKMIKSQNLILKEELTTLSLEYQPVDIYMKKKVVVLTGANMAGKTSILKSIGQAMALLLHGIPIPAESAELFIPDYIHFSGPLTQEHRADLSSFALEVVSLQQVVDNKHKGLILMDEFARGTNPEEGTALSQSVISYFSTNDKGLFITATHFNPPAHLENTEHFRLIGLSDDDFETLKKKGKSFLKDNLKEIHKMFNYQMIAVDLNSEVPKAAFKIAELLGLDDNILSEAKKRYHDEIQNIY